MKNLLFLILTVFTLISCDKEDDKPKTELEKLPPATQTGERTFGCLLDDVAFVPTKPNCSSFYQYVNGYYFSLQGNLYVNKEYILLGLSIDNLKIEEGKTYILQDKIDGNASAAYLNGNDSFYTSSIEKGEMKISKLDLIKHIVSGTFWYDIKDGKGVTHKIREGRFDMPFTQ